jgi:Fe-S oxidoreductase
LINELAAAGKLHMQTEGELIKVTFHDPCYLGRHNQIFDAPRDDLKAAGNEVVEMPRHADKSFCCGAGGAQMWKEEEHGDEAVNVNRFNELKETGAETIAVGCPFCAQMMNDANVEAGSPMKVKDVAEIVVDAMNLPAAAD